MTAPTRKTLAEVLGRTIREASDYDPQSRLVLTDAQRAMLAETAAAEYCYAASSILEPYGYTLTRDGEIVQIDADGDSVCTWDEDALREGLNGISVPWTQALARATSTHNALLAAETASAEARAARDGAIVEAAHSGAGAHRIAEATGAAESEVSQIIAEALR